MNHNRVIIDGPSKFDLMVSLFDGKIVSFTHNVLSFDQQEKSSIVIKAIIMATEPEDGSHQSWNLKIYVKESELSAQVGKTFSVYYNSRIRKGTISLILNKAVC